MINKYDILAILGPTAAGKTDVAAHLAYKLGTEVISADSRQVYRRMDLGTGKDLEDYVVEGQKVPYHLIDIAEPGYKYNVFEYQRDFLKVYSSLKQRELLPVVCGGSGLYIESVIRGYNMSEAPKNETLRAQLEKKSLSELVSILKTYGPLHNTTDVDNARRTIRAIEIEEYKRQHPDDGIGFPQLNSLVVGVGIDRESRREKISKRLKQRLDNGMVEEIRSILDSGVSSDDLIYYGLEYKYVTQYVIGKLSFDEMYSQLEIAIHQFAKRQMTWFRGMERRGVKIHWIDALKPMDEKVYSILELLNR